MLGRTWYVVFYALTIRNSRDLKRNSQISVSGHLWSSLQTFLLLESKIRVTVQVDLVWTFILCHRCWVVSTLGLMAQMRAGDEEAVCGSVSECVCGSQGPHASVWTLRSITLPLLHISSLSFHMCRQKVCGCGWTAAPIEPGTRAYSQPLCLQAESLIMVPFLLPRLLSTPAPPPPPLSCSSSRWLWCLLALLLPLGLVVMSKAVRQTATTHKVNLSQDFALSAVPSCLSHCWLGSKHSDILLMFFFPAGFHKKLCINASFSRSLSNLFF